ncbi:complement C1q tumor necrosis factor-related protein 3-like [Ruditapes philippinarum]|uniref:complement C1q tumor necrosis factor-related protein 3-like n=1 Tax=Ruditapes philippinarum TaxID=129788 RepID=UPI00295A87D6|nr:complement C1q tumor necrosis factor-related protein 3-like [Ruditapes philippinarum]
MDAKIPFAFQLSFIGFCLMISFTYIQMGDCAEVSNTKNELAEDIFSTLQSLRSEVQSLKAQIAVEGERNISPEERRVSKKKRVAFYARVSPSITKIAAEDTIVFSLVETNSGEAYNPSTGEFKVPFAGTYVFFSNILSGSGKFIETCLKVNGKIRMLMYSGGKYWGSGSNMAVLELKAGDIVNIAKKGPWGTPPLYIHHLWSTFSGFLLY